MIAHIFEDEHIRVIFDDRKSEALMITFNELYMEPSGLRYWGDSFMQSISMSCIGVVTKSRNWFPQASMRASSALVQAITKRYQTCFAYGFSQGGYGALKYGKLMGAKYVLAFSPQISIDPKAVGSFDRRFSSYYEDNLHSEMKVNREDIASDSFLFYDPHCSEDSGHVKALLDSETIIDVPINFVGHGTVRVVANSKAMRALLEAIERRDSRRALFLSLKHQKKSCGAYYVFLAAILRRGNRHELSRKVIQIGMAIDPKNGELARRIKFSEQAAMQLHQTIRTLQRIGEHYTALRLCKVGREEMGWYVDDYQHPAFVKEYLRSLLEVGKFDEAEQVIIGLHSIGQKGWPLVLHARALHAKGKMMPAFDAWAKVLIYEPGNTEAIGAVQLIRACSP